MPPLPEHALQGKLAKAAFKTCKHRLNNGYFHHVQSLKFRSTEYYADGQYFHTLTASHNLRSIGVQGDCCLPSSPSGGLRFTLPATITIPTTMSLLISQVAIQELIRPPCSAELDSAHTNCYNSHSNRVHIDQSESLEP